MKIYTDINYQIQGADIVIAIYRDGSIKVIKERFGSTPRQLYLDELLEIIAPCYKLFQPLINQLIIKIQKIKSFL